ncbi:MAG: hypothetical protein MK085_00445 [Phycisphaerales bacterium]|nr:hypothetical protein [Phycisphaerales bacterium]
MKTPSLLLASILLLGVSEARGDALVLLQDADVKPLTLDEIQGKSRDRDTSTQGTTTRQGARRAAVSPVPDHDTGEEPSWFLSFNAGVNMALDADLKDITPTGLTSFGLQDGKIKFKPGMDLDLAIAWPLASFFSMDVQTGLAWNSVDSVSGELPNLLGPPAALAGGEGNVYQIPVMTNAIFDIGLSEDIFLTFNVGIGFQFTYADISGVSSPSLPGVTASLSNSSLSFRYQVGAELRFEVSPGITLGAFTRFSGTTENNFGRAEFSAIFTGTDDVKADTLMNVAAGFNLRATF